MRYGDFWNLTWWDQWTFFQRMAFVIQAAIAVVFVPTGLVLSFALSDRWWFGAVMALFSTGWLGYQYLCWQQFLDDRRTALRPPSP